jgi:hypothetical protein
VLARPGSPGRASTVTRAHHGGHYKHRRGGPPRWRKRHRQRAAWAGHLGRVLLALTGLVSGRFSKQWRGNRQPRSRPARGRQIWRYRNGFLARPAVCGAAAGLHELACGGCHARRWRSCPALRADRFTKSSAASEVATASLTSIKVTATGIDADAPAEPDRDPGPGSTPPRPENPGLRTAETAVPTADRPIITAALRATATKC